MGKHDFIKVKPLQVIMDIMDSFKLTMDNFKLVS
jgi:hypothetical protein